MGEKQFKPYFPIVFKIIFNSEVFGYRKPT